MIVFCCTPLVLSGQETGAGAVAEASRLRDAGQFDQSIVLLKAHLRAYPNDGDAIRLLAQTQYWAKDFSGARETYERAVKLHPEDTALRAQYAQFLAETASQRGWITFSPAFRHDDQPLDRLELQAEAGWFLQTENSINARVSALRFRLGDTASRNAALATIGFTHSDAKSGFRLDASGGLVHRSFDEGNDFVGSGSISGPLNSSVRLRGLVQRDAYFYTEASLSNSVMTNTGALFLSLSSASMWLGEVSGQFVQFPDDNSLTTAYAWVLAPLRKSTSSTFHVGYSASYQNSSELRFELENPNQTASPSSPNFNFAGRYNPYYTPMSLQTHSVIVSAVLGLNTPAVLRLNGGYAVVGSEDAPRFTPVALTAPPRTEARLSLVQRDTHPWNARASLELNAAGKSPVTLGAETSRTAFYSSVSGFAAWTLKF